MPLSVSLRRRRWLLAATSACLLLAACDQPGSPAASPKASFNGVDITGAAYAQRLSMKDVTGRVRTLDEFKGKVVFVFFGFTQCPDVCPTTMAELAQVRRQLGPDGDKVQGVFVTVDPERDTAEVLQAYLGNLDKAFLGLRGTPQETDAATREFKVFYQKVPTQQGQYTIDHTAGGYLFDPQGRVRLFVRYGMGAEKLGADIKQLLAGA